MWARRILPEMYKKNSNEKKLKERISQALLENGSSDIYSWFNSENSILSLYKIEDVSDAKKILSAQELYRINNSISLTSDEPPPSIKENFAIYINKKLDMTKFFEKNKGKLINNHNGTHIPSVDNLHYDLTDLDMSSMKSLAEDFFSNGEVEHFKKMDLNIDLLCILNNMHANTSLKKIYEKRDYFIELFTQK